MSGPRGGEARIRRRHNSWRHRLTLMGGVLGLVVLAATLLPVNRQLELGNTATLTTAAQASLSPSFGEIVRWDLEPGWTLRSGNLAVVGEATVIAGIRVERPARTAAYSVEEVKVPWLFHGSLGELELPVDERRAGAITSVHPVATGHGNWLLLWGEGVPPADWVGSWPPFFSSELWVSERRSEGWTQPRNLVAAGQVMLEHGSTVRHAPDGVPLVMLPIIERPSVTGSGPILFGSPLDTLRAIPTPRSLLPYQGSFAVHRNGSIEAVVLGEVAQEGERLFQLVHLVTEDVGRSWSAPSVIASWSRERYAPSDLSVYLDSSENLHVVWSPNQGPGTAAVRHLVRGLGPQGWKEVKAPGVEGAVLRWTAGSDRQGVLTMVQEFLMPTEVSLTGLQSFRWSPDGGWSEPEPVMPGSHAGELFGGLGVKGEWRVGWSGIPGEDMPRYRDAPPVFSVYVWTP